MQKLLMKFFFNLQVFIVFFNKYAEMSKKILQVAKTCDDVFIFFSKRVMFFIKSVKNDLKSFEEDEIVLIFLSSCKKFWVLNFAKID